MFKRIISWIKAKFARKTKEVQLSEQEQQELKIAELKELITERMGWDEISTKKIASYGPPFSSSVTRKKIQKQVKECIEEIGFAKVDRATLDLKIAQQRIEPLKHKELSEKLCNLQDERQKILGQLDKLQGKLHGLLTQSSYTIDSI